MTVKKILTAKMEWWQSALGLLLTIGTIAGIAWATLATPCIDKQIHQHTDPINDALMYQNCLLMQRYTSEEIAAADRMYTSLKRSEPTDKGEK